MQVRSDSELVNAVLGGDMDAFAVLVGRYERAVRAVALSVLGNHHTAADAGQEAFVKAYERLPNLRRADSFGPWLMKIAKRCALDAAMRKPRETSLETNADLPVESGDGWLDDEKQLLLIAVASLPKAEKQVIMLRYFGGHSVKDVAGMAGKSVGTVTKQLCRARGRLRKMLMKKGV